MPKTHYKLDQDWCCCFQSHRRGFCSTQIARALMGNARAARATLWSQLEVSFETCDPLLHEISCSMDNWQFWMTAQGSNLARHLSSVNATRADAGCGTYALASLQRTPVRPAKAQHPLSRLLPCFLTPPPHVHGSKLTSISRTGHCPIRPGYD
jgi:hypothetical protein